VFTGAADAMRQTMAREGFAAFYKGFIPVAGAVVPRVALQYTGLAFFKPRFEDSATAKYLHPGVAAGICTGVVQSVCVVTPLELLKQRQQTELSTQAGGEGRYQGSVGTLRAVLRDEGFSGLYKGLTATMVRQCWGLSVKFYGYFTVKTVVQGDREPEPWHGAVAGGLTNVLVGVLVCPPDIVKVRMQNNGKGGGAREYKNIVDCVAKMATQEGPFSFFKGAGLRVLRIAPGGMIQFYVAEWLAANVFNIRIGGGAAGAAK